MKCPSCAGKGKVYGFIDYADGSGSAGEMDCSRCKGRGFVPDEQKDWIVSGEKIRKTRINWGITLRQRAKQLGISASELSKMERGEINPQE